MFKMFRKIFNRKRECPECGFQGSSREFKRAGSSNRKKNMKHTHEIKLYKTHTQYKTKYKYTKTGLITTNMMRGKYE